MIASRRFSLLLWVISLLLVFPINLVAAGDHSAHLSFSQGELYFERIADYNVVKFPGAHLMNRIVKLRGLFVMTTIGVISYSLMIISMNVSRIWIKLILLLIAATLKV